MPLAMTLIEAAKTETRDMLRKGIIEIYSGSSAILQVLPFLNIEGNAYKYNAEAAYPGVGYRGVNEGFTPSIGVINPKVEALAIMGGDLDVDKFLLDTSNPGMRAMYEAMQVKALSLSFTRDFFKGSVQTDQRVIDGLMNRVTGDQVISNGSTANGTPLSLLKLDEAIDRTLNPTHVIMNRAIQRRLSAAARNTSVSGYIGWDLDAFGNRVMSYNGLPIITVDLDNAGSAILGFNEAADSGTDTATSIYVVNFGIDGVTGLQNGGIQVRDLGELDAKPVFRTRVEWYAGIAIFNGRAVTRLRNISDAAVTA